MCSVFLLIKSVLMLPTSDNFLLEDLYLTCFRQIHGIDDHHLELLIGNCIPFHIAPVCEIDSEVKLDAKLRLRIGDVHRVVLGEILCTGYVIQIAACWNSRIPLTRWNSHPGL